MGDASSVGHPPVWVAVDQGIGGCRVVPTQDEEYLHLADQVV